MFHFQKNICKKCREERSKHFPQIVESEKIDGSFSPLFEGFSSLENEKSVRRVDCLIVSESIGNLKYHIAKIKGKEPWKFLKDYYMKDKLETFNQQEIRKLLKAILRKGLNFYFTDVVKCFVKKGDDENFELAVDYCTKYLKKQLEVLKPKIVILLGRKAEKAVFQKIFNRNKKLRHGGVISLNGMKVIYSEFPSARNADRFVKGGGVNKLIKAISSCENRI